MSAAQQPATPLDAIRRASAYDRTIRMRGTDANALMKKYLPAIHFRKELLFDNMLNGITCVFDDYPIHYRIPGNSERVKYTLDLLRKNLKRNEKIYIRYGASRTLKRLSVREVLERWERGKSRFGVTDLHFRETNYFEKVDADSISYFNLLPLFSDEVSFLEMLTLVISSTGIFSDSHSDDGDGSNHCIVGKKLWFAWDKEEGQRAGLQDCTYENIFDQARFSIKKFLGLKSGHWFLVSEGQTLFMPGNFTHKVITLENYIGFGSFYVSFPNYVNSLKRWILKNSTDVTPEFIDEMNRQCLRFIKREKLRKGTNQLSKMGYDYFKTAVGSWKEGLTGEEVGRMEERVSLAKLFAEVGR